MFPNSRSFLLSVAILALALLSAANRAGAADYDDELSRIGRELTDCLSGEAPLKVAAVDFTDLQGQATELGRLLAEELSTELAMTAKALGPQIVDRNHLRAVLKEHELSSEGLIDPKTAKELGRFAGIDVVVTGNVLALDQTIKVTAKAIRTESATIACASRGEFPKTMVMREMLGVDVVDRSGNEGAVRSTQAAATDIASVDNGILRVSLKSFIKRRDGREVHMALGITNTSEKILGLLVNTDRPPLLVDNVGSEWRFVGSGGVPHVGLSDRDRAFEVATAVFPPKAEHIATFVFETEGSPGKTFSLGGTVSACEKWQPQNQCWSNSLFDLPLGLANIELR